MGPRCAFFFGVGRVREAGPRESSQPPVAHTPADHHSAMTSTGLQVGQRLSDHCSVNLMPLPQLGLLAQGRQRTQDCVGGSATCRQGEGRADGGGNFGLGPGLASCSLLGAARAPQEHILGTKNCDGSGEWELCSWGDNEHVHGFQGEQSLW